MERIYAHDNSLGDVAASRLAAYLDRSPHTLKEAGGAAPTSQWTNGAIGKRPAALRKLRPLPSLLSYHLPVLVPLAPAKLCNF